MCGGESPPRGLRAEERLLKKHLRDESLGPSLNIISSSPRKSRMTQAICQGDPRIPLPRKASTKLSSMRFWPKILVEDTRRKTQSPK